MFALTPISAISLVCISHRTIFPFPLFVFCGGGGCDGDGDGDGGGDGDVWISQI